MVGYVLLVYIVVYFTAAMFWRSYRLWRKTGVNPYVLGAGDNVYDFVGQLFRLTLLACFLSVLLYALWPAAYALLTPIAWLSSPVFDVLGALLLAASLVWVLVAQAQMGASWRIGIDKRIKTDLVQTGVFGVSRNPIFLGMRVTLLGLFLALPNALSLAVLVLGEALIQIQVRLEEAHLSSLHPETYAAYRAGVRRWL